VNAPIIPLSYCDHEFLHSQRRFKRDHGLFSMALTMHRQAFMSAHFAAMNRSQLGFLTTNAPPPKSRMVNVVDSRLKISFPRDSAAIDCFLFVSLASFPMSVRRMLTSSVDKKCAVEGISQEPISYSQGIVLIYILSKSYGGISDEDRHIAPWPMLFLARLLLPIPVQCARPI
jgi:hypothetical protein